MDAARGDRFCAAASDSLRGDRLCTAITDAASCYRLGNVFSLEAISYSRRFAVVSLSACNKRPVTQEAKLCTSVADAARGNRFCAAASDSVRGDRLCTTVTDSASGYCLGNVFSMEAVSYSRRLAVVSFSASNNRPATMEAKLRNSLADSNTSRGGRFCAAAADPVRGNRLCIFFMAAACSFGLNTVIKDSFGDVLAKSQDLPNIRTARGYRIVNEDAANGYIFPSICNAGSIRSVVSNA